MTKRQESGFNWRGVEFGPEEAEGYGPRGDAAGRLPSLSFSLTLCQATGG